MNTTTYTLWKERGHCHHANVAARTVCRSCGHLMMSKDEQRRSVELLQRELGIRRVW